MYVRVQSTDDPTSQRTSAARLALGPERSLVWNSPFPRSEVSVSVCIPTAFDVSPLSSSPSA